MCPRCTLLGLVGLCLLAGFRIHAEPGADILKRRATIFARILSYDGNLARRAGNTVDIAVLYKRGDSQGSAEATALLAVFESMQNMKVAGLGFTTRLCPFQSESQLEDYIVRNGTDAVVLVPGLEPDFPAIKRVTRRRSVLSMGNIEGQVNNGISVVVSSGESGLAIYVNLSESLAEGALFSSDMLRLAKVIR